MNKNFEKVFPLILIVVSGVGLFLTGHVEGKHAADRWYAEHRTPSAAPVLPTRAAASCTGAGTQPIVVISLPTNSDHVQKFIIKDIVLEVPSLQQPKQ